MSQLIVFPSAEDVFFENVEKHEKYLLPLLTLDLKSIDSELEGPIHFVLPQEPFDNIGFETKKYHTYYSRYNWVAYKVIDGKYKLETDFNFFQNEFIKAHPDYKDYFGGVESYLKMLPEDLNKELTEIKSSYDYLKNEFLSLPDLVQKALKCSTFGGKPFPYIDESFPCEFDENESEINGKSTTRFPYPLTEDGRRFKYIGCLDSSGFSIHTKDKGFISLEPSYSIILYYDPVTKIALSTLFGS